MLQVTVLLITGFLVLLYFILQEIILPVDKKWRLTGSTYKLPPGPAGQPIVGNLLQFMQARKTRKLFTWLGSMRQYGDMTTLHLGSQTWILLNSRAVADDIITKNGRVTNERPPMPIASDLVSHGKRTVIRPMQEWSEGRRVMHHLLSGSVLRTYGTWQELVSLQLLSAYLKEPERWYAHHYHYSLAVLYRVVFGDTLNKTRVQMDAFQHIGIEFVDSLAKSMIDFFPSLARLPVLLQPWRPFWKAIGDHHRAIMADWWALPYSQVMNGTAKPSFIRDTLLHPAMKYKGNEEEAMYLAISVITAGGDNTRMTLNTFVMAMIANPQSFARAREEIDNLYDINATKRLPGIQDIDRLPFVAAVIKEVLRWRPTVPLVPPHQLTEDLVYKGYVFPKGVCFVVNNIAISQGHKDWDTFDPDRWIDGTQSNVIYNHWAFGGGRRICVGYRVAQQALFIAIVRLIYCFDLIPRDEYDTRVLNHQSIDEPFPVEARCRGPAYQNLIEKELDGAIREERASKS